MERCDYMAIKKIVFKFICKLLGHTPLEQKWFTTFSSTDVATGITLDKGWEKGSDWYCKRCGIRL